MREIKRLRRIVAVRTTQRDLSAMQLLQAQRQKDAAEEQRDRAEARFREAAGRAGLTEAVLPGTLERMDANQAAARAERNLWEAEVTRAAQVQAKARAHVEAQHRLLQQSERLTTQAVKEEARQRGAAEQKATDELSGRESRGPL